jgi:hypothetical protein
VVVLDNLCPVFAGNCAWDKQLMVVNIYIDFEAKLESNNLTEKNKK